MSTEYVVIMQDDFDFNYINQKKIDIIKKLQNDVDANIIQKWHGHIVVDFNKNNPENYSDLILSYCTSAIYYSDLEPYNKYKLKGNFVTEKDMVNSVAYKTGYNAAIDEMKVLLSKK